MKILVTGGAGFIGSNLVPELEKEHEVHVIDNLSTGNRNNLHPKTYFYDMDLSNLSEINQDILEKLLRKCDVVYHLAASIGVKLIDEDPDKALQNSFNIDNTLFPLFQKYNNKVIFASTSEVYGLNQGCKEDDILKILPIDDKRGGYACAKLMSEFLLRSYSFPSTIVRFFNVVGNGQVGTYGHVLPRFIQQAKLDEPLTIYGQGLQTRSFCDVRDAVEMLKLLIDSEHDGEVYNIGNSDNVCCVRFLATEVVRIIESDSEIEHYDFNSVYKNIKSDIEHREPNTSKMDKYYKAQYSIQDIIESLK